MEGNPGVSEQAKREQARWEGVHHMACEDAAFRDRLIADPKTALRECDIELPDSVEVRVREFDPNVCYLFLPPKTDMQR